TPHNHACAMRRSLDYARVTQVGIRSMSTEEAEAAPGLNTTIFYDALMRKDPAWIDRVVDTLSGPVYITIDVDGMDPAIMPATRELATRELANREPRPANDVYTCYTPRRVSGGPVRTVC